MAKLSDLPEELLDAVFGQLERNSRWADVTKRSLKRCSLVCSSWCRLSRRHLFRAITIHTTHATNEEMISIQEKRSIRIHTPDQLFQFLTTHGHIADQIREFSWVNETDFFETPYSRAFFLDVLFHFPSLKTMYLTDMFLEPASLDASPPTLQLERLLLQAPGFIFEEGYLDVLGLIRNVGVLELYEAELGANTPQLLRCSTAIQPHTLILRNVLWFPHFITVLQSAGITNHLNSVLLDNVDNLEELQAVSRFLSAIHDNLESLEMDFHWVMSEECEFDLDSALRLRISTKLHTLILNDLDVPASGDTHFPAFWTRFKQLLTLCQENVSTLRDVKIDFVGHTNGAFCALKACLIATMGSSRTSQTVTIFGTLTPKNAADMADLSHLCDSGVLRFRPY